MPGPEMNAGLDAGPVQPRDVAVVVPGPCFGENLSPLLGRLVFPLALSIEFVYIDCIFLSIRRLHIPFLSNTKISVLCRSVTFQSRHVV